MQYLRNKFNSGSVTYVQLVSWGLAIITTMSGIFWAKVSAVDTQVIDVRERTAVVEEAISTLKEDQKEIKADVKEILGAIKR